MGGKVHVESTLNIGSKFFITTNVRVLDQRSSPTEDVAYMSNFEKVFTLVGTEEKS